MNTDATDLQIQMALLNYFDPCKSVLSVVRLGFFVRAMRAHQGLLALDDMFFERRNIACGNTDATGASRNFIHMFSYGRMRAQKILNQISVSHNYR